MSTLGATWLDFAEAAGRALAWSSDPDAAPTRAVPEVRGGLVDLFVERARDTGALVERVAAHEVAGAVARARGVGPDRAPRSGWRRGSGTVDIGAPQATLGVATAGCLVLTARTPQAGPLPDPWLCIVHASALVFGVPEAVALLDRRRSHTWVRGALGEPDLELDRVGPVREQHHLWVLLVG